MARPRHRNGLSKRYGDFYAVREVSLTVADGEFLVLLGPSGCGKTTTLRMVAGFIEPTGRPRPAGRQRRHPAAAVEAQCRHGVPELRAVPAPDAWRRTSPSAWRCASCRAPTSTRRVEEALALVRLGGYGGRLPRQLSGGQQQRVALARALAIRPDVLLLDEPLSNLDAKLRQEVRVEIRELQRQLGLTTVMVTHDQEEALTMADRLVVMNEGSVRQVGSQRDLYERPADRFVAGFVGRSTFLAGTVEAPGRFRSDGGLGARLRRRHARAAPCCRCGPNGSKSARGRAPDSTTACPVRWNSCPISAR